MATLVLPLPISAGNHIRQITEAIHPTLLRTQMISWKKKRIAAIPLCECGLPMELVFGSTRYTRPPYTSVHNIITAYSVLCAGAVMQQVAC